MSRRTNYFIRTSSQELGQLTHDNIIGILWTERRDNIIGILWTERNRRIFQSEELQLRELKNFTREEAVGWRDNEHNTETKYVYIVSSCKCTSPFTVC
jgi:hypothetical protein